MSIEKWTPAKPNDHEQYDALQARVAGWKGMIMPRHLNTPRGEFDRGMEEVHELDEAITQHDGTRASEIEIGEEAADVMIRMMGILAVVRCNAGELIDKKIAEINKKYPPPLINGLMQEGMEFPVAMKTAKTLYERQKPPTLRPLRPQ